MKPLILSLVFSLVSPPAIWADEPPQPAATAAVKVATFDVDATPPLGSAMAYDPVKRLDELTLRCRGIVIIGSGKPIVLCAVDWIGIANEGHDLFREKLAQRRRHDRRPRRRPHPAPARRARVRPHGRAVDPRPRAEELRPVRERLPPGRDAAGRQGDHRCALASAQPATHYGWGVAAVKEVASNRRILGPDGKVRAVRYTATKDPALRAEPEGVIDPEVSVLSFWNGDRPVAVLSYYACHPQSYYRTGVPSPDFPGIARFIRGQAVPEALHVHFNGAGGNIGAGKYNDGDKENRMVLAQRLADGMKRALAETKKQPLTEKDVGWETVPVKLPVAPHLKQEDLIKDLKAEPAKGYVSKADQLAWVVRCKAGHAIDIACLRVGQSRVLHMPGELFVEYQLAAKKMRPDLRVAMAAYGDYGPAYIGTTKAYAEGGYETSPTASNVAPEVEPVLMDAMKRLLGTKN